MGWIPGRAAGQSGRRPNWRAREGRWWLLATPGAIALILAMITLAATSGGPPAAGAPSLASPASSGSPAGSPTKGTSPASPSSAAPLNLCTSDANRYPSTTVPGTPNVDYLINPDEWNATAGLCLRGKPSGFTVTSSALKAARLKDPQLGPGAYANISTQPDAAPLPIAVGNLRYAISSWKTTQTAAGSYDASYDLWYSSHANTCSFTDSAELMVWLRGQNETPTGYESSSQLTVGGAPYRIYEVPKQGAHTLIIYAAVNPSTSVTDLDLRAFTRDAVARGYVPADSYFCAAQAGFEIWEGGTGLSTDYFSFDAAAGAPSGAITSEVPGTCLAARGNVVLAASCDGSTAQSWTMAADGTVVQNGQCLTGAADGNVTTAPCSHATTQKWHTGSDGNLVNQSTDRCLDIGTSGSPGLRDCAATATQGWYLPQ